MPQDEANDGSVGDSSDDPQGTQVTSGASCLHLMRWEVHAAQEQAEALIALSTAHTLPQQLALGRLALRWALAAHGGAGVRVVHGRV